MRFILLAVLIALGALLVQGEDAHAQGPDDEHAPDLDAPPVASRALLEPPVQDVVPLTTRPEPSLRATDGREALLVVPGEPHLARVAACLPGGETVDLERQADGDFAIRFTLPEDARRAGDRIEVRRHLEDGRVDAFVAFFVLDRAGTAPLLRSGKETIHPPPTSRARA